MGKCEFCLYWVVEESGDRIGECRRNPPTVYSGISDRDEEDGLDVMDLETILARTIYPVTTYALGCGEFVKGDRSALN
jgi:hypothetical protein